MLVQRLVRTFGLALFAALTGLAPAAAQQPAPQPLPPAQQAPAPQPQPPAQQAPAPQPAPDARTAAGIVTVINGGRTTIMEIYVASTAASEWGPDRLGADVLPAGRRFQIDLSAARTCTFDLRIVYQGGRPEVLRNADLCARTELTFSGPQQAQQPPRQQQQQRPQQPRQGTGETREVVFHNRGQVTIQVINISSSQVNDWGPDRLGAAVLPAGRSFTVAVEMDGQCLYDIRVLYQGGREETRMRQNICETREFEFRGPDQSASAQPGRGQPKGPPGAAQPQQAPQQISEVTIVNRSNLVIEVVNISSSRVNEWGDDLLGAATIPPGERHTLRIPRDGQCDFDIRVVFQGGREERRMRQNICEPREFAFSGPNSRVVDGGGPADGRLLTVINDGPAEIMEIYMTPVTDTHWGGDRLGVNTLPRRHRLEFRATQAEGCRWDVRIVYRGGAAEERRDVDMCATAELRIARRMSTGGLVSTGTGFYVSANGHILTNQHVVDGCSTVAIAAPRGGQRIVLERVAEDEANDLALLRQVGATTAFTPFRARGGPAVRAGDRVVLVGFPARQELGGFNVTEGLISSLRGQRGDATRFQYTAPTLAGNSGGPVIDETGLVVGVVVAQLEQLPGGRQAQNVNFGIQLDVVRPFLEANGVTLQERPPGQPLRPAEILERALPTVLALDCLG